MSKKEYCYVVWKGFKPGVYENWADCKKQVQNFPNPSYMYFDTLEEAVLRWTTTKSKNPSKLPSADKSLATHPKPEKGIIVDGSYISGKDLTEYQFKDLSTGKTLYCSGPISGGSNNVAEFLGIVEALKYCKAHDLDLIVYSDSTNAMAWIKKKAVNTAYNNKGVKEKLTHSLMWLIENDIKTRVVQWETRVWGENPADFGRK